MLTVATIRSNPMITNSAAKPVVLCVGIGVEVAVEVGVEVGVDVGVGEAKIQIAVATRSPGGLASAYVAVTVSPSVT